jgi:sugar diacid utilization regulator
VAREDGAPERGEFDFMRQWGEQKARDKVPLPASLHSYFTAQRILADRIVEAAGPDVGLRAQAVPLFVRLMECTSLALTASLEGYSKTLEGERGDREMAQRELLEDLITKGLDRRGFLARRAAGFGLEEGRSQVAVITRLERSGVGGRSPTPTRWAAQALASASGRGADAFVVVRSEDVVAILDSRGDRGARIVVEEVRERLESHGGIRLTVGIGTPFTNFPGLPDSYDEARRALRHCTARRPVISSPDDISLVEDLAISSGESAARLIPLRTRKALGDPELRSTLRAYVSANLSVAAAAKTLILHPNSVRYRLKRIATLTGRDPRQFSDLFELRAAARILEREAAEALPAAGCVRLVRRSSGAESSTRTWHSTTTTSTRSTTGTPGGTVRGATSSGAGIRGDHRPSPEFAGTDQDQVYAQEGRQNA